MLLAIAIALHLHWSAPTGESLGAHAEPGAVYSLRQIDGAPFPAGASLSFAGIRIDGRAPCGDFTARIVAPYPWFEIARLRTHGAGCPAARDEAAFFEALGAMELAEVAGPVLVLTGAGREMVFRAD